MSCHGASARCAGGARGVWLRLALPRRPALAGADPVPRVLSRRHGPGPGRMPPDRLDRARGALPRRHGAAPRDSRGRRPNDWLTGTRPGPAEKETGMGEMPHVLALYPYNRTPTENVHPPSYRNPTPAARYHLVVI